MRSDWERHYDTLFWTVTTLFAVTNGGLLTYIRSEHQMDPWLSVFGLAFAFVATYLAASFRQLRQSYHDPNEKPTKHLPQWLAYLFLFWLIGLLWIISIDEMTHCPQSLSFLAISIWAFYIGCIYVKFNKRDATTEKTITVDLEAYNLLNVNRQEEESFSQVIKRFVSPPLPPSD